MAKLTRNDAINILSWCGIPPRQDFHALHSKQISQLERKADERRYRAPKLANGSRLRYFHAYLVRTAERDT